MAGPIPVTIISGFLGAGKTTLLNYLLNAEHGLRVAVLVNDFGAVNIDAALVTGVSGESTIDLSNGCICCSIRDDLFEAVVQLIQRPDPPEYIVVETSGVSDPVAVSLTFIAPQLQSQTRVDSVITVVDSEHISQVEGKGRELALDQIATADMVVLNKIDLVDKIERKALANFIRKRAPSARIFEAIHGAVPLDMVLGVGAYDLNRFANKPELDIHVHSSEEAHAHEPTEVEHHEHHEHTLVYNTWSYTTDQPLSRRALLDAVKSLPTTIYRAKGIVLLDDTTQQKGIIHFAGQRTRLIMGEAWGDEKPQTQLVFIGEEHGINTDDLQARFDACRTE
ncbi:MAG: CobW family GTP-binding protein [Candidatus Latescibacterota bacterium]